MVYGLIQTAVEVHKRVGRPELVLEFFPGDHLPRTFQQHGEDLESLISELDLQALLTQLPGLRVDFERAKTDDAASSIGISLSHEQLLKWRVYHRREHGPVCIRFLCGLPGNRIAIHVASAFHRTSRLHIARLLLRPALLTTGAGGQYENSPILASRDRNDFSCYNSRPGSSDHQPDFRKRRRSQSCGCD